MAEPKSHETRSDVCLIGAGPIGIEMAVELQREGIDYVHIERGQIAQTMTWFPRLMTFFSSADRIAIAGVPIPNASQNKCTREDYLAYLRAVVQQFDLPIRTYEEVVDIAQEDGAFVVRTQTMAGDERTIRANRLILAIGDTHAARLIGVPGEDLPHVSHYFVEPHTYFRRRLLVVGARNSAVEAALRCYHAGAHVTIAHLEADFSPKHVKYWILPEFRGRIDRGEIEDHAEVSVERIEPGRTILRPLAGGDAIEVAADFVLLMTGYTAEMQLFRQAGVNLQGQAEVPEHNADTMESNVPGLYVIGTATAGSQQAYTAFIETSHIHVDRVVAHMQGRPAPQAPDPFSRPES